MEVPFSVNHQVYHVTNHTIIPPFSHRFAEDFTVPECMQGTELDFHFSAPVKGNLIRVEINPLAVDTVHTYAQHISVLAED